MHWTAFLAYRRFPAHARVADDLACTGCGYNLRTALANGRCPECGRAVGDSLFVLNKPEIVGQSLRTIGNTYLGIFVLVLAFLPIGANWPVIVEFGVLGFLAVIRAIAAGELRYRGGIESLPIVGVRLNLYWWLALIDAALACVICVLWWINAKNLFAASGFHSALTILSNSWLMLHILGALVIGWLGTALATMLWYTWARWEFIAQRVGIAIALAGFALSLLVRSGSVNSFLLVLSAVITFLPLGFAMIATTAGLVHLGNGAESERETWEDIIDVDPQGQYSRPSDTQKPEPPAIKLE